MKKTKKFWIAGMLFLALAGLLIYSIWSSEHNLIINYYECQSEKVQEDVKIIVLSDMHEHEFGTGNEDLVQKIEDENPDLILLAGDFVNEDSQNAERVIQLIVQLKEIAPVYFAWGNHELAYIENTASDLKSELSAAGAVVLEKEYVDVEVKNSIIRIGGLYGYAFGLKGESVLTEERLEVKEYLENFEDTDNYKIMMAHRPDSFIFGDASKSWDIDLVVSGHNHGGQVVVPFLGGLFGGDQGYFPEYVHGMYQKDGLHIFVTSGLGTNPKPLPRINNCPEIAVLTILAE